MSEPFTPLAEDCELVTVGFDHESPEPNDVRSLFKVPAGCIILGVELLTDTPTVALLVPVGKALSFEHGVREVGREKTQ
mgnify:CR=1 FL=1